MSLFTKHIYCTVCFASVKALVPLEPNTDEPALRYECGTCGNTFADRWWLTKDDILGIVVSLVTDPLSEEQLMKIVKEKMESKQSK